MQLPTRDGQGSTRMGNEKSRIWSAAKVSPSGESFYTVPKLCSPRWESVFIHVHPWLKKIVPAKARLFARQDACPRIITTTSITTKPHEHALLPRPLSFH